MKVAVVTTQLFDTPRSGGELCTARLLAEMVLAGHRVSLIGRGPRPTAAVQGGDVRSLGPQVAPFASLSAPRQALHLAAAWATGEASTVHRLAAQGAAAAVQRWLMDQRRQGLDLLVVDHLQAYAWVGPAQTHLPRPLVLMHNLESEGYRERASAAAAAGRNWQARVFRREMRLLQALEQHVLHNAAAVACLSEHDAQVWRSMSRASGASPHIDVLPGFPLPAPAPTAHPPVSAGRRRIGLLGTWTWGPNRQALDWMLAQVLPRLPGHCRLLLAGAGLEGLQVPPQVQLLGRVPDVADFYGSVDLVAVPSQSGSGVHEKAIEALARAPAVVASGHALRGLQAQALPHLCVADSAEDFAHACAHFVPPEPARRDSAVSAWAESRRQGYGQALARCVDVARPQAASGAAAGAHVAEPG